MCVAINLADPVYIIIEAANVTTPTVNGHVKHKPYHGRTMSIREHINKGKAIYAVRNVPKIVADNVALNIESVMARCTKRVHRKESWKALWKLLTVKH